MHFTQELSFMHIWNQVKEFQSNESFCDVAMYRVSLLCDAFVWVNEFQDGVIFKI